MCFTKKNVLRSKFYMEYDPINLINLNQNYYHVRSKLQVLF
jgi:hypothetical protein